MNWLFKAGVRYAYRRAQEPSTWRGLILSIGGVYAASHPELVGAVVPVLLAVVGAIGAMCPDVVGQPPLSADSTDSRRFKTKEGEDGVSHEDFNLRESAQSADAAFPVTDAAGRPAHPAPDHRLRQPAPQQATQKPARAPANVRPIPTVQPAADPSPHNPWGDDRNG